MKHVTNLRGLWQPALLLLVGLLTIAPTPCNLKISEYPGSSEKPGREDTSDVFAVDHELIQPFDPATGMATGVRQHRPLTVLKQIDKASPGFHKALTTGQTLNQAVLDFYRLDPVTREEVKYYTITLTNVRIVGMKTMVPTSHLPENQSYGHMEEVRLVYEQIEWRWIPDNVVEQDKWKAPTASAQAATSASQPPVSRPNSTVEPVHMPPSPSRPADPTGAKPNPQTGGAKRQPGALEPGPIKPPAGGS